MNMNVSAEAIFSDKIRLLDTIHYEDNPTGIITAVKLSDGQYHVLSRYEDSVWQLPHHWFPHGVQNGQKKLNFERIGTQKLRVAAKLIMARQLWGSETFSNRKAGKSYINLFDSIVLHLHWLKTRDVSSLADITPMLAQQYVQHVKSLIHDKGKRKGTPITANVQTSRFMAVETCWRSTLGTVHSFEHPWPESSASVLSGLKYSLSPKTSIIPDVILAPLAQWAEKQLSRANELIAHRDSIAEMTFKSKHLVSQNDEKNQLLKQRGWPAGLRQLKNALFELRDSAFLLILLTTGMRIHELLNIKRGCWYSQVKDGERFYFIGSRSDKTNAGHTHWLCPKIAIDAVNILERLSSPLNALLKTRLRDAQDAHQYSEVKRLEALSGCIALSVATKNKQINVLSGHSLTSTLQIRIEMLGLDWHLTPHQFRRTFANYVVHHKLGDLRYLRDHFKHWSLDMAALYAMNEVQDLELYDEIYSAFDTVRQGIIGHWLEPDTPLSGGLAPYIRNLREKGEHVRTYASRKEMIKAISNQIFLRSTSIAWCTNDDGGCGGGQCESCEHGVIDDKKQKWWEAVYVQQIELRQLSGMGEAENLTIERAITRCEKVLAELGADIRTIKERVT
jgi:integrase